VIQPPCDLCQCRRRNIDERRFQSSEDFILAALVAALMVIALVDTIPDPPAVNPHTVSVASRICEARGGVCEQLFNAAVLAPTQYLLRSYSPFGTFRMYYGLLH
jgi:hypothetical protein